MSANGADAGERSAEAEELLARLIRFNTVNPPGDERAGAGVPRGPSRRGGLRVRAAGRGAGAAEPRGEAARQELRRPHALLPRPRRHGARGPGRLDARPVVGGDRRRLPVGARRARHEVAGRRGDRRGRIARALRLAPGARRSADRGGRGRGDGRLAGRAVDHRDAPREGALRPARQRGRRRGVRVRRHALLRRVLRGEGRVPLHRHHRRRGGPRVDAEHGGERAAEDGARARAPRRSPARATRRPTSRWRSCAASARTPTTSTARSRDCARRTRAWRRCSSRCSA